MFKRIRTYVDVKINWVNHLGKRWGSFLKVKHLVAIWPRNVKSRYLYIKKKNVHTNTQINIHSNFIIALNWEQFKYLSVGKWINKLLYILTRKYYSSIKVTNYCYRKQYECITKLCWMKETRHKRTYGMWFHLYGIIEKTNQTWLTETSKSVAVSPGME